MSSTKYYLNENCFIKLIDFIALYNIKTDVLYEMDEEALELLKKAENGTEIQDQELLQFGLNEGIFIDKPVIRKHPPIKQAPKPSLRYLELQITKRCNLRCKHCFVGKTEAVDLPFDKIVQVLKEFEELQGLRVLITGGEPLLHPEFKKINEFLKEVALRKILLTNGTLITEEILKELNVEEIQFSIDGMRKGHDALRGRGSFDKTINALKRAMDSGFQVSVATVIHKKNIKEFDELGALIKDLKIKEWTVDALTVKGNLALNKQFWVHPKDAYKILREYGLSERQHPRAEGYGCGVHLMAVVADGKAAFCSFYEDSPIGDIDEGLENLWKKKQQVILKELDCTKVRCPFINLCFGGCRARAESLSGGNPKAKDLFKCYQFGRYV